MKRTLKWWTRGKAEQATGEIESGVELRGRGFNSWAGRGDEASCAMELELNREPGCKKSLAAVSRTLEYLLPLAWEFGGEANWLPLRWHTSQTVHRRGSQMCLHEQCQLPSQETNRKTSLSFLVNMKLPYSNKCFITLDAWAPWKDTPTMRCHI